MLLRLPFNPYLAEKKTNSLIYCFIFIIMYVLPCGQKTDTLFCSENSGAKDKFSTIQLNIIIMVFQRKNRRILSPFLLANAENYR